jgi:hypothetical protein
MSGNRTRSAFASRPGNAETWIGAADLPRHATKQAANSARLTIDVTPALRARIKVSAFQRGMTVADLIRDMLREAFPEKEENPPP